MHGVGRGAFRSLLATARRAVIEAETVDDAITRFRDHLGFDHVTYLAATSLRPLGVPFLRTTYPPQWIARYVLRDYLRVDPVVRMGFEATEPFVWSGQEWTGPEGAFMADALAHGVGDKGYCIPLMDRACRRSILSLNTSMAMETWAEFLAISAAGLEKIARLIHEKAVGEFAAAAEAPALAPREVECLLWTARGKDAKAIAVILGLSEFTVRSYLRTARRKLGCRTLSQAVARAVLGGLINP